MSDFAEMSSTASPPTVGGHSVGRRARLRAARVYAVSDSRPAEAELESVLAGAIRGGAAIVQLRDKRLRGRELAEVALRARALCLSLGALFIVNDDAELALEVGADGVHVGQNDAPVGEVRARLGPELLIGLSTHSRAEIDEAGARGPDGEAVVDYIGVGPVFETPTKADRPPVGLGLVRYAAAHAELPFFAIGGISPANVGAVVQAGAARVAAVRAIAHATDPEAAARSLSRQLDQQPLDRAYRASTAA
jgi:thiamine-phosphate pyrophosphorylase